MRLEKNILLVFQGSGLFWQQRLSRACNTNQEAVNCQVCNKVFYGVNRKFLLKRHLITHSGEKPFECPYCDHKANIKQNLDNHIRRKHFDTPNTLCS